MTIVNTNKIYLKLTQLLLFCLKLWCDCLFPLLGIKIYVVILKIWDIIGQNIILTFRSELQPIWLTCRMETSWLMVISAFCSSISLTTVSAVSSSFWVLFITMDTSSISASIWASSSMVRNSRSSNTFLSASNCSCFSLIFSSKSISASVSSSCLPCKWDNWDFQGGRKCQKKRKTSREDKEML